MIKYLFHISDVHVFEKNYVNLKNSFRILVDKIKEAGIDQSLCVIVGDIFESKSYLSTDDIFNWKAIVHLLQTEGIKTLILVGNHDYNINSELVRDNVSLLTYGSIIKVFNQTSIVSGDIFGDPNLEFYMFSPIDKKIPQISDNKCTKIALLHESINAAKYDNGQAITGCRFNAGDLAQFDYVLLGDIHKQQYLTDRIAYCGSFVQKNKGESIHKGYILWDLQSGTSKFHAIPLKEVYIKVQAVDDKCELPQVSPDQKIRYTALFYKNCSHEYVETIKHKMVSQYTYINRIVNNTDVVNGGQPDTIQELAEIKQSLNHEDLIKKIIGDDPRLPKILEHHRENLVSRVENNHTTYVLNYLCWGNIYCYVPNNWINFREFHNDLVMLSGNNKDGKSSIIDIIIRILYNEAVRGPKDDIVNKSKNEGYIKISFNVGADEYIVEQIYNKSAKTQFHRLYKNDQNISQDTIIQTYAHLRNIIGDYKSFVNLTTALQNRKFLVDMSQKDFITLLTEITNIDILKDVETDTKKEINLLKSLIKKATTQIEETKPVTESEMETIRESRNRLVSLQTTLQQNLKTINQSLVEIHKGYINAEIPENLLDQIKESVARLKGYPEDIRNLYLVTDATSKKLNIELSRIEREMWSHQKILEGKPTEEIQKIASGDYTDLKLDERQKLEKKIKELQEITHKPKQEKCDRDKATLEGIIGGWVEESPLEKERCEIQEAVILNDSDRNDVLLETGLPDYNQTKLDVKKLQKKIENFKSNFGSLTFNQTCHDCNGNKLTVHQIFNIKHESQKLASLQHMLDTEDETTNQYNLAKLYRYNRKQNEIFERNQQIKKQNQIIKQQKLEYEKAVKELETLENATRYEKLQRLEKRLSRHHESDIKVAKLAYDRLTVVHSYLVAAIQYIELTELYKIQKTNGNRVSEITKLNKQIEETGLQLDSTNRGLMGVMDEYRLMQSEFDKLSRLHGEHKEHMDRLEFMNLYFSAINCKTGIPSYILKNTCSTVERACNEILGKIADFTIQIIFDKDIKIYTVENDISIPAQMGSGMQKFVLDLIFRITLTEISSISCPKTLFVDEGFGSLDKENFIGIANILQKLKSNFDSLIIISHITELNSYVDKTIKIVKNGHLSNVQFGALQHHEKEIRLLFETNVNNKRAKQFKDDVKTKMSKISESIESYCAENGGMETVLFEVGDDMVLCRGCNKEYKNRSGFIAKHMIATSTQAKHAKYISSLV
jgi:DNA repair exonuclease SbcCD ATPase subunit